MAYKAVKSNVVSCPTFGQNSGRVKATRCCTVAIASVFLFFSVSFSRDNGAYEYGTTQMWPGTIIIQDTLFSFHFYYYGLWFWGSTIDRQVQPFNQTLQPQLTAIVVEYEYEYLTVYPDTPETTPLPMETISLHSTLSFEWVFWAGPELVCRASKSKKKSICLTWARTRLAHF